MRKIINEAMEQAVADRVFPGAVVLVMKRNDTLLFESYGYANLFSREPMMRDTIFDLASLTKPLATTLGMIKLVEYSKLDPERRIDSVLHVFKNMEKGKIKIRHLLCHTSGLPAYRPYYKYLRRLPYQTRKNALRTLLIREPLVYPIGKEVIYSDLGFMMLAWIVETVAHMRLDKYVSQEIYAPLGLSNLFFIEAKKRVGGKKFAATEWCPWRHILLDGVVHDDNTFIMGGVAGHAGLFGNADNLKTLLSKIRRDLKQCSLRPFFNSELLGKFLKRQGRTDRALGFDMPSPLGSSCGKYFSADTIGHLGFTGTSFWVDLTKDITVILLTNRVHPSRYNNKMRSFRPKLHDLVMKHIVPTIH